MPLRIHVFQHVPYEGIGALETIFAEAKAFITLTRFFQNEKPPAPDAFDFLVVMGGPMGVYDEKEFPWLLEEKRALQAAFAAEKAILGICLGAQLMAEVLGGAVSKNPHREIGWFPVQRLPEANGSWAAACFPEKFTTFHWHGDTFAFPRGADPLFRSEGCARQGFVWGDRAVALQFHPEITADMASAWVETGAGELQPGPFVQTPEQIRAGRPEDFTTNHGCVQKLCENLIRKIPVGAERA